MPLSRNYDRIFYPNNIDAFALVTNGNTPDNIIDARLVNKVSNALQAIESHMRYTVDTPTTTGYYLMVASQLVQLSADLPNPGLLNSVQVSVFPLLAQQFFSNSAFARSNCIFATGVGYNIVNGQRSYFPTRAAVNAGQELSNYTLSVDVVKTTDKWRAGDYCEVTVMITRPAPAR